MIRYILNIHTATETAIVNLSRESFTIHTLINTITKEHATFLHPAINEILKKEGITMRDVVAVAATAGPGSYTGIRVGLAAARGLCYALKIPLISFNSLELIALSTINFVKNKDALYCPMIDARRREVYTAIYNFDMQEIEAPSARILDENYIDNHPTMPTIFSGSGSKKFQSLTEISALFYPDIEISSESMTQISWNKYQNNMFNTLSFEKPLYIKEFYTTTVGTNK
ncbi:MAG: tRNA (adenosine(37)-N6)-threonylcarbamoyltransferase complex dimerization subunit type 1 TsaB [Ginsengibacter sp.]